MILVIDVGNTNVVLGLYEGDELIHHWRISTNRTGTADEYGMGIMNLMQFAGVHPKRIEGVIYSSVVPQINHALEGCCEKYLHHTPLVVGPGIRTGLNIRYENPKLVGADRIVNAVAAMRLYGRAVIVIDFGTATTFEYIDESGSYLGGAIVPGIGISMEALYQAAAKLPRIEFEMVKPKSVVGRDPVGSIQSGLVYGFAGQVDGIVTKIHEEFSADAKVVATGGLADFIAKESRTIDIVDPLLTLKGLKMIYEMNTK